MATEVSGKAKLPALASPQRGNRGRGLLGAAMPSPALVAAAAYIDPGSPISALSAVTVVFALP